jgi:hypothetical protein
MVVDDKDAARRALKDAGVTTLDGSFLDFRDPWGNRIEIVGYDNIQTQSRRRALGAFIQSRSNAPFMLPSPNVLQNVNDALAGALIAVC